MRRTPGPPEGGGAAPDPGARFTPFDPTELDVGAPPEGAAGREERLEETQMIGGLTGSASLDRSRSISSFSSRGDLLREGDGEESEETEESESGHSGRERSLSEESHEGKLECCLF